MHVLIENIGKIKRADLNISGISIIAGLNNTGKSTVSKSLYAVSRVLFARSSMIKHDRESSLSRALSLLAPDRDSPYGAEFMDKVIPAKVHELLAFGGKSTPGDGIGRVLDELIAGSGLRRQRVLTEVGALLALKDEEILRSLLSRALRNEFFGQVNSIFENTPGRVVLKRKTSQAELGVESNEVTWLQEPDGGEIGPEVEPVYIDSIAQLNYAQKRAIDNHDLQLRLMLERGLDKDDTASEALVRSRKVESVLGVLSKAFAWHLDRDSQERFVVQLKQNKYLDYENLSAGLKPFAVVKRLLENGTIAEGSLVIFDEPEIHLHPRWIGLFAESLVMMQQALDLRILINTHSPNLVMGIEVFGEKYGAADRVRYYLAAQESAAEEVSIIEGEQGKVRDRIYNMLGRPLLDLQKERDN